MGALGDRAPCPITSSSCHRVQTLTSHCTSRPPCHALHTRRLHVMEGPGPASYCPCMSCGRRASCLHILKCRLHKYMWQKGRKRERQKGGVACSSPISTVPHAPGHEDSELSSAELRPSLIQPRILGSWEGRCVLPAQQCVDQVTWHSTWPRASPRQNTC